MPDEKEIVEKETEKEPTTDSGSQDKAGEETASGEVASDVLERAKAEFGIDETEAKTLAASGALTKMFSAFDRGIMNTGRAIGARKEEPKKEVAPEGKKETKDEEFPELKEEEDDPKFIKVAQFVKNHHNDLKAVKEDLLRYKKREQIESAQNEQVFIDNFDSFIAGLGAGWAEVFGKGKSVELKEDSPEYKNRLKLATAADDYNAGAIARGLQPPPEPVLFKRALGSEFLEELTKQGKKEIADKLKGRKGQHIARPTTKEGQPLTAKERAIKVAEDKARQYGLVD